VGSILVAVEDVPDPKIERPTDAIVRITSTNICGSDLHNEGRTDFEQGRIFGHENLGVVLEVGPAVERIKAGDWSACPSISAAATARTANAA
jgi:threonine dehydrogenase-like Zn-dependent dehydrogenase